MERPAENNLKWYASEAKRKGEQKVEFGGRTPFLPEITSGEQAVRLYTIVLAQVVGQFSAATEDGNKIDTWYKLRIIETLSEAAGQGSGISVPPPARLGPLSRGEFAARLFGGSLVIDGVEVSERGLRLEPGRKYLMFIDLSAGGSAGFASANRVFKIDLGNKIERKKQPGGSKGFTELIERHGGSIEGLRAGVRRGGTQ